MSESTLARLFDYQRFAQNSSLQAVLNETEARWPALRDGVELDDDQLMLNAAADIFRKRSPRK